MIMMEAEEVRAARRCIKGAWITWTVRGIGSGSGGGGWPCRDPVRRGWRRGRGGVGVGHVERGVCGGMR